MVAVQVLYKVYEVFVIFLTAYDNAGFTFRNSCTLANTYTQIV